jgi:tetratricopeptide (TPR) repeat protein
MKPLRRAALVVSLAALATASNWSVLIAQTAPADAPSTAPAAVPAVSIAPPGGGAWKEAPAADAAFDRASAERFAWVADMFASAGGDKITPAWAMQAAGLYDIARRAAPNEVRFHRGYVDACLKLGRREQAVEGLAAIRKLDPSNELAQVQTLDLALDGLESADAKVSYLEQVVAAESVTPEVRAHAAVEAYSLYTERGEDDNAARMLKRSLEINPQNLIALNVHLTEALTTGSATDKASRLQDVLMASPFDPRAVITLAHLASANGANQEAAGLYSLGTVLSQARGATPSFVDIESQLGATALTGDSNLLQSTSEIYLRAAKDDARLHTCRVVAMKLGGKTFEEVKPLADEVRGTWLGRVSGLSEALNRKPDTAEKDIPAPSTAPSQPMPPIDADVAKVRELKNDELSAAYAESIGDLVYYDAILRREASSEQLTRAIANLVGEQSPTYALAEGVRLMRAGQTDLARQKLQAIEKDDDRAAIALAELERAAGNADGAKTAAAELLKRNPAGLTGVYAAGLAVDVGVKPEVSDEGKAVAEIAKACYEHVTRAWQRPRDFYLLTAEPVKVGFEFGEPILAVVTLRTTSQTPVTVGPSGMLNPVVNFDAVINVAGLGPIPAIGSARLTGPVRLNSGESYKQIVRLDQPRLFSILGAYPTISMPMRVFMTPNSIATERGAQPLPGSVQTQIGRVIERRASPMHMGPFVTQTVREMREGPADVRLRRYELLSRVAPLYRTNASSPQAQESALAVEKALQDAAAAEPSPRVKAWMQQVRLSSQSPEVMRSPESIELVKALLADGDEQVKAIGSLIALELPLATRTGLADMLSTPDASVALKDLAEALRTIPEEDLKPAATQPATQPAR